MASRRIQSIPHLIGLTVQLSDGKIYGKIIAAYNFGAGAVIDIEKPNGKTEMLPFQPPFVDIAKVTKDYVIINPPDYLEANKE